MTAETESVRTTPLVQSRPVVVLNMHFTGLAIARGLRNCGAARIYGLGANESLFGNYSRYCQYVRCPDTLLQPEQCRDFLLQFAGQFETPPLLIPTRDHDLQFLSKFHGELQERYIVAAPAPEMLSTILNKAGFYRIADELGIAYPMTAWINSRADLESVRGELSFPVIVKPVYSTQWRKQEMWDLVGRQKAAIISDYDELLRFYAPIETVDPMIHIQEFIPGGDDDLVIFGSYLGRSGQALRFFTGRKLLQYPAQSGTGVAVRACLVPGIIEPSHRLLARLGYRGVSEIEFKLDRRSGKYVLIEMNPRFWDQHGLGTAVGVNLAECLFSDLTEGYVPEQSQNAKVATWIAEEGYLMASVSNLKTKAYSGRDFVRALKGKAAFAVLDIRDWRPAAAVAFQLMRDATKEVSRRVTRRFQSA